MNKKLISAFLAVVLLVGAAMLSSCSQEQKISDKFAAISMKTDKPTPSKGEEFTVNISVENGELFCCMDLFISYNSQAVKYVSNEVAEFDDFVYEIQASTPDTIYIAGYVATTLNITNDRLISLTFKVRDDAPEGTDCNIGFTDKCNYLVGNDAAGDSTVDVSDKISLSSCDIIIG